MSVQPDPDLEPPVALVTEATSGIGRAIALKLASDGHYVIGIRRVTHAEKEPEGEKREKTHAARYPSTCQGALTRS